MKNASILEVLLGSAGCSRVLMSVHLSGETYAREIARAWGGSVTPVQKQLEKLERGGILCSRTAGRTRLYSLDPTCPLCRSIERLLEQSSRDSMSPVPLRAGQATARRSRRGRPVPGPRRGIRALTRRRMMS